jgi:hypothetical protein
MKNILDWIKKTWAILKPVVCMLETVEEELAVMEVLEKRVNNKRVKTEEKEVLTRVLTRLKEKHGK